MAVNLNILRKNMRLLRNHSGLSQSDLSAIIHLTRSTYCSYETGSKVPDLQTLDALAALYEISLDSLINYDLSTGILNRIYFTYNDRELAELLNAYQALSVSSKFLVAQRLDVLLEKENSLYRSAASPVLKVKK